MTQSPIGTMGKSPPSDGLSGTSTVGEQRMEDEQKIHHTTVRLVLGDITELPIEAFVFYAQSDLALGSGFGGAISVRGGPSIQEELKKLAPVSLTEAVITAAGELNAQFIIHAVGPKFQEENLESLLAQTITNVLRAAEKKKIKKIAFPPMGAGFYGVPLPQCAAIMFNAIGQYLRGRTGLQEVVICLLDSREYKPFKEYFATATWR